VLIVPTNACSAAAIDFAGITRSSAGGGSGLGGCGTGSGFFSTGTVIFSLPGNSAFFGG
jgi:hypothetical protein